MSLCKLYYLDMRIFFPHLFQIFLLLSLSSFLLLFWSKQLPSSGNAYSNISLVWGPFQTATWTRPQTVLAWRQRVKLERCQPLQPTSLGRQLHPKSLMIQPTTVTRRPSCPSLKTKCVQCKSIMNPLWLSTLKEMEGWPEREGIMHCCYSKPFAFY